jgi:uncharacterized protein (TIGR00288 family)
LSRSPETRRIALLMDFENIVLGLPSAHKFKPKAVLGRVLDLGKVVVKKAYADWSRYDSYKVKLHELGFDLMEIPRRAMTGKNSADIRMVVDAMDMVISNEHLDTFALITGDSDFTPLVGKLREHDKHVIGIGVKAASSKLLIDSCDEFIFYDEIEEGTTASVEKVVAAAPPPRAPKGGGGGGKPVDGRRRAEGLYLVFDAARSLLREYDTLWASMVKQAIVRKHPAFTETFHDYPTFSAMVEDAVALGLLEAKRDEKSGNWRITGLGERGQAALKPGDEPKSS